MQPNPGPRPLLPGAASPAAPWRGRNYLCHVPPPRRPTTPSSPASPLGLRCPRPPRVCPHPPRSPARTGSVGRRWAVPSLSRLAPPSSGGSPLSSPRSLWGRGACRALSVPLTFWRPFRIKRKWSLLPSPAQRGNRSCPRPRSGLGAEPALSPLWASVSPPQTPSLGGSRGRAPGGVMGPRVDTASSGA